MAKCLASGESLDVVGSPAAAPSTSVLPLATRHCSFKGVGYNRFELKPTDPVTMVAATCVLATVALLAGYLPAQGTGRWPGADGEEGRRIQGRKAGR